ncbi:hypothetical protein AQUCO_02800033v1 [Aquilegia coerulea]|uniref:Plastid lipid-associated protein/fibrillin conserved domain-containing protein n=1 Tax=Aquilegia coerulea TaxID=218851 RepID=A0A2G5D3L0_AQUCA|nr:hypothetical protein AQUCO_02800033v1 [Aquilegia coerulea]
MVSVSTFYTLLPSKTTSLKSSRHEFGSKNSISTIRFTRIMSKKGRFVVVGKIQVRRMYQTLAISDDDDAFGVDPEEVELSEVDKLKKELTESFYGTDCGSKTSSETRGEITELTAQLEAKSPTTLAEGLETLNGKWKLVYTSFAPLYPLLWGEILPLVKVEEISETIDSDNLELLQTFQFVGPLATTSISSNATFEVKGVKRLEVSFNKGIIEAPKVASIPAIPVSIKFGG